MFDVKSQSYFNSIMLTRTHERNCCLMYDYVTDDAAADMLGERDLDLVSMMASLLTSRPTNSSLSHQKMHCRDASNNRCFGLRSLISLLIRPPMLPVSLDISWKAARRRNLYLQCLDDAHKEGDQNLHLCANLSRVYVVRITTGSQALDELLGGGIETLQITEAFGEFSFQPTLPTNMKGGNDKVAYIDTERTFQRDRIVPIAERFGMDVGAVLDNIIYACAYTYEHQYNLLLGLAAKMSEEPFRLLVLDSKEIDRSVIPVAIPLSSEQMNENGIYLLENGEDCLINIGSSVDLDTTRQLFGISFVDEIPTHFVLQQYENLLSKKLNEVINEIRSQRCNYLRDLQHMVGAT